MFSIALKMPNMTETTSWYRAMGPLNDLRRRLRNVHFIFMNEFNWATVGCCDALFMQRPYTDDHLKVFRTAKRRGVPVWTDYDDLLLALPTDNPAFFVYMRDEIQKNLQEIISKSDIVTVSTEYLKKCIAHLNKNVVVVNNALDMNALSFLVEKQTPPARKKIIAWRGSATHQRDVFTMAPELINLSKDPKGQEWKWHWIGDTMWFATDNMVHENTFITAPNDVEAFHESLFNLGASALIVPLAKSHFNLCKSNIAWLEATWTGAAAIVPKWPEWDQPGAITYDGPVDFAQAVKEVMGGLPVEKCAALSREKIMDCYTLEKVNPMRADVLCSLLKADRSELGWRDLHK